MKSKIQFLAAVALAFVGASTAALAVPTVNTVPEPGSLALVGAAVAGVLLARRRK